MLKNAKTAILVIIAALVALVLILVALLVLLDKDPTQYVGSLTTLVGVLASSGILAALIGKTNEKAEESAVKANETAEKTNQIAKSVNGNTSYLIDVIRELSANNPNGKHVAIDEERISQIQADSDALTGPTPIV